MIDADDFIQSLKRDGALYEAHNPGKQDFDAMGSKILEAVGIPLVTDWPHELGLVTFMAIGGMGYNSLEHGNRSVIKKEHNDALTIAKKARELRSLIDSFCERTRLDAGVSRHRASAVARKFNSLAAEIYEERRKFAGVDDKPLAKINETADARLSILFKHYFGTEPAYNCFESAEDRAEKFYGAWWCFVRAASDAAHIPLSEEAMRKARQPRRRAGRAKPSG